MPQSSKIFISSQLRLWFRSVFSFLSQIFASFPHSHRSCFTNPVRETKLAWKMELSGLWPRACLCLLHALKIWNSTKWIQNHGIIMVTIKYLSCYVFTDSKTLIQKQNSTHGLILRRRNSWLYLLTPTSSVPK